MSAPDFVVVGHVTLDRFDAVTRPGGTALFAGVTAWRLGLSVGILTSHGDGFPLDSVPPQIEVVSVPAAETTVFEHANVTGERTLRVASVAGQLTAADVPEDWTDAPVVLLAPVLDEVDAGLAAAFGDAAIAATAQGWLRSVGGGGAIGSRPWNVPPFLLAALQAVFLSGHDIRGQEAAIVEAFQRVPIGVLTAGRAGALLFVSGERYEVPAPPARLVDPTGAGDVFAAAFLAQYRLDGDPWEAAEAAACAAALSVEGEGWSTVPDRAALADALVHYRRAR